MESRPSMDGPGRRALKYSQEMPLCSGVAHLNPWVSVEDPVPDSQDNTDPQSSLSVTFGKSCSVLHGQGIWGPKR